MNTEDFVSKEREEAIYRERNKARRDAGGVGPLSQYDFGVGFRAALGELNVTEILEAGPTCEECAMVAKGRCLPPFCPTEEGGATLVRAKDAPPKGA